MKKKISVFLFCILAAMCFNTACQNPANSGGSGNDDNSIALQFSVDSDLNGTYKTSGPKGVEGMYYITLKSSNEWEFGQNSSMSVSDNNSGASASSPVKVAFYKGTFEKEDDKLIFTKTHVGNDLLGWKESKVDGWKTGSLKNSKTILEINFTESDLKPFTSGQDKTDSSDEAADLKNTIVFPVKQIYKNFSLNGKTSSLTVNNKESAKYYMSFKDEGFWSETNWELGINVIDSNGNEREEPLYKGSYTISTVSGMLSRSKSIELNITHVYEVNEWVDLKVNKWRVGSFDEDDNNITFKFSDEDLVPSSEEILKNNDLVESEIKEITETSTYSLTKHCKLSAVKKGLDYLKQNKPDIKIDLDLSQYPGLSIGNNAFSNCTNIKSVIFSEKLLSICKNAFEDCTSLEKITISKNLASLDSSAFEACTNLKSVYYKGSLEDWCKNTWSSSSTSYSYNSGSAKPYFPVGYDLYFEDKKQTEISIPETVQKINYCLFANCKSLTKVSLPETVTEVLAGAFKGCSNLASIEIPASVVRISSDSFEDCTNLSCIYYKGSLRRWCTSVSSYSSSYSNDSKSWNASVFSTAYDLYIDNKKITELDADALNNITSLCDSAFKNCKSLTKVTVPDTSFGSSYSYNIFKGCSNLTSVSVGQNALDLFSSIFDSEYITDVVILDGVTSVDSYCFSNLKKLESITIPSSVKTVGYNAFDCDGLTSVNYGGTLKEWCTADTSNDAAGKSWKASVFSTAYDLYIGGKKITELDADALNNITSLCTSAFENCKSLTKVTVPDTITSFGSSSYSDSNTFKGCSNLTSVSVGQNALDKFSSIFDSEYITEVVILDGVTSGFEYYSNPFSGFSELESITIPASVTKICDYGFPSSLTSVIFEDTTSKWYKTSSYYDSYKEDESNKPMSQDPAENAELLKGDTNYNFYISEKYTAD